MQTADVQMLRECPAPASPSGLPQPGELEMVDGEGGGDRQQPAGATAGPEDGSTMAREVPDRASPGLPEQEEQDQAGVRREDVRRPLEWISDPATHARLH